MGWVEKGSIPIQLILCSEHSTHSTLSSIGLLPEEEDAFCTLFPFLSSWKCSGLYLEEERGSTERTNGDYFEERSYSTLLNRAVSRSKPTRCFAVCARTSTASAAGLVALLQTVSASNCLAAPGSSVHTNGRTESLR